jgi:hypothetical protein
MNCKTVHNKLIFFLEKELSVSEMKQVQKHLEGCSDCALFVDEMRLTLGVIESDKITDENPFFYTRVKARMENQAVESYERNSVLVKLLQPIAFSIVLLLGIYGGFKLGQPTKTELADIALSERQMIPYLNEMDAEPIEAFLMK